MSFNIVKVVKNSINNSQQAISDSMYFHPLGSLDTLRFWLSFLLVSTSFIFKFIIVYPDWALKHNRIHMCLIKLLLSKLQPVLLRYAHRWLKIFFIFFCSRTEFNSFASNFFVEIILYCLEMWLSWIRIWKEIFEKLDWSNVADIDINLLKGFNKTKGTLVHERG